MSRFRTNKQKDKEKREALQGLALLTQLGVTMTVAIFMGVFIGIYLDKWLGTSPWMTLVFSFIGIGAAFRSMYYQTNGKK